MHRKKEHREKVPSCRRFRQGDCELSDDSCWFIHEEITDNDGDTFVDMETEVSEQKEEGFFHKVQEKAPPDQLKLILERLDMLSVQVYQLKRSQNKK